LEHQLTCDLTSHQTMIGGNTNINMNESKAFPISVTERLILRQLSDKDVQEVFLLRSDKFINKYLDRQPCTTIEDAFEFIEKIKNNSLTYWAITQKGDDKLVGTICLFNVSEELKTCEIGYELLAEYQGKGIMKEAANEVIKFAAQTLEIETIDAYTHQDNESSNNLLKALKFISANTVDDVNTNLILFQLSICKVE
jgi:ribosomal-protein-alanine N-acetyltransferase